MTVDAWKKIREDGATGLLAVITAVTAAVKGRQSFPEMLRIRWRLRDARAELGSAYAELGEYVAMRLGERRSVKTEDESAGRLCRHIAELRSEELRLLAELGQAGDRR